MNTHTPPSEDGPLDRDERELADLYRQLPDTEPGPELDARVLAEAEHAVSAPRKRARAQTWLLGLSSAAALVLAGGLAWQLHQPRNRPATSSQAPFQLRFIPSTPSSTRNTVSPALAPAKAPPPKIIERVQPPRRLQQKSAPRPPPPARALMKPEVHKTRASEAMRAQTSEKSFDSTLPAPPAPPALAPRGLSSGQEQAAVELPRSMRTLSVSTLVDNARTALAHHDKQRARRIVRAIRTRFPDYALPDDLAALAPASASSAGPP